MIGDTPVTLAGTALTWTERQPDMSFDVNDAGRLRHPVKRLPHGNTGVSTRGRPRTYRWRSRHLEDELFGAPVGQETS